MAMKVGLIQGNRNRYLAVSVSERTFLNLYRPLDWFFRIKGYGLSILDHREMPPLFSERNGFMRPKPWHVGPYCIRKLTPKGLGS